MAIQGDGTVLGLFEMFRYVCHLSISRSGRRGEKLKRVDREEEWTEELSQLSSGMTV